MRRSILFVLYMVTPHRTKAENYHDPYVFNVRSGSMAEDAILPTRALDYSVAL